MALFTRRLYLIAAMGPAATQVGATDIVLRIREATSAINVASREVAAGIADLSQHTEQQASSLEETASSLAPATAVVKQNAEHARRANQLRRGASSIALKGSDVVASVEQGAGIEQVNVAVTRMDEITQQNAALEDQAAALAQLVGIFRLDAKEKPRSILRISGLQPHASGEAF